MPFKIKQKKEIYLEKTILPFIREKKPSKILFFVKRLNKNDCEAGTLMRTYKSQTKIFSQKIISSYSMEFIHSNFFFYLFL